jgi:hypothetical protein
MWQNETIINHSKLLSESYTRWTGKRLIDEDLSGATLAQRMYEAPFVIVSHDTQSDPVFNYANKCSQDLWKIDWNDFLKLPSRLSAEAVNTTERQKLLEKAQKYGYVDNYEGLRITSEKKKFRIIETVLWNVVDDHGTYLGQAATFSKWEFL